MIFLSSSSVSRWFPTASALALQQTFFSFFLFFFNFLSCLCHITQDIIRLMSAFAKIWRVSFLHIRLDQKGSWIGASLLASAPEILGASWRRLAPCTQHPPAPGCHRLLENTHLAGGGHASWAQCSCLQGLHPDGSHLPFPVAVGFFKTLSRVCPSREHSRYPVLLMSRSVNHSPLFCHSSHFSH